MGTIKCPMQKCYGSIRHLIDCEEDVKHETCSGRPNIIPNNKNVPKVKDLVRTDIRLSVKIIAD